MKMLNEDIEIIECYKTKDDIIYKKKEEAMKAILDLDLEFLKWYEDNKLFGNYECCKIDANTMLEWLKENRLVLKSFIKTL